MGSPAAALAAAADSVEKGYYEKIVFLVAAMLPLSESRLKDFSSGQMCTILVHYFLLLYLQKQELWL